MRKRRREVARAGIFGSVDNPQVVLAQDLKEIAETWQDIGSAPVKLGSHRAEGNPRLGNVVSVSYDADTASLWAEIEEHDVLARAVDEEGFYPDVSIGARARASDGRMYLHHIAYLGDEPPAVKNLRRQVAGDMAGTGEEVAACDGGGRLVEFPAAGSTQLCLSDTPPAAGAVENMPGAEGDSASLPPPAKGATRNEENSTMTEEEFEAMRAENERLRRELQETRADLADRAAAQREGDKAELAAAADGRLTEAEMGGLMELADSLGEGRAISLSDGGGASLRPVQFLSRILSRLPLPVEPGALDLSDPAGDERRESLSRKMMGRM